MEAGVKPLVAVAQLKDRLLAVNLRDRSALGAKGHNVTLKGEDYVQKVEVPGYCRGPREECVVMIDSLMDDENTIVLGMPFLKKMMGIFNWDEKTVSCEFIHSH